MDAVILEIIGLSVRVAVVAVLIALPFAFGIAYLLARREFAGKSLLQALVTLPLVLPPVVTGYLLLLWFGPNGPGGVFLQQAFGFSVAFRWTGAALAAAVMAFPLLVRPIRLSLEGIDRGLEDAAATLGASRITVFLTVTLPLALPGILAGAVLAFAKALGEFGATITFVSNIPGETRTLSLAVYSLLQSPDGEGQIVILIVAAVILAVGAVLISEFLSRRLNQRGGDDGRA